MGRPADIKVIIFHALHNDYLHYDAKAKKKDLLFLRYFFEKTNARGGFFCVRFFQKQNKFDKIMGTILWINILKRGEKTNVPVPEKQKI